MKSLATSPTSSQPQLFVPQVWLCPLSGAPRPDAGFISWLDAHECDRYQRFKHPDAAQRFFLARLILKSVVAGIESASPASISLSYSPNGKPFLPERQVARDERSARPFFSISHSATGVAVAVAPFDFGIDLESIERPTQPWKRPELFLHPEEAKQVSALPIAAQQALVFTHRWTCQEAAIKLLDSSVFNKDARIKLHADSATGICNGRTLCFSSWQPNLAAGTATPFGEKAADGWQEGVLLSLAAAQPVPEVVFRRWCWSDWC